MKLKSAAKFFDSMPVYDGYSGALLFKVQGSTFLENNKAGTTSARRIVSVAPDLSFPSHSVVMALNQLILIGESVPDEWKGDAIRRAFWTKTVTDSFQLLSPATAALGLSSGSPLYGQKQYLRESINTQVEAEIDAVWRIYLAKSAGAQKGYFLKTGTTLYFIRVVYEDLDGFLTCQSDELDEAEVSLTFTSNGTSYDPVSDSYVSTVLDTKGIFLEPVKAFNTQTQADFRPAQGDMVLVVGKLEVTPSVSQLLTANEGQSAGSWRVLGFRSEVDSWFLHVRRA